MAKDVYLIWSHEHKAWWRADGVGYTSQLSYAGHWSRDDAIETCRKAIPGTAGQLGALPELPVRLTDVLEMLRNHDGSEYMPGNDEWE